MADLETTLNQQRTDPNENLTPQAAMWLRNDLRALASRYEEAYNRNLNDMDRRRMEWCNAQADRLEEDFA